MYRPYKYLHTLTLLIMAPFHPILENQPILTGLILSYIDLGLESKVVRFMDRLCRHLHILTLLVMRPSNPILGN